MELRTGLLCEAHSMIRLPLQRLRSLRDELRTRGQRPSTVIPKAAPEVAEAVNIAEEYGPLCEAMFLMMASDGKVLNIEREVLRGALDVLSAGRVRTSHMEAMIDAAAKRLADEGFERRCRKVIEALRDDPVRSETTLVLAAAVAAADGRIAPQEDALFETFAKGLDLDEMRAREILAELTAEHRGAAQSR